MCDCFTCCSVSLPPSFPLLQRKFDSKYGPTWHCIVGSDFKAAFTHESKNFIFVSVGKHNVLLFRAG